MPQSSIAILVANGLASSFLRSQVNFVPWDCPLALTVAAFVTGTGGSVLLSQLAVDDLAWLAVAASLVDVPTLAVSVLSSGTADRRLPIAALNTVVGSMARLLRAGRIQGVAHDCA
jgi:hypothetical protein